jgi:hypothetical protein
MRKLRLRDMIYSNSELINVTVKRKTHGSELFLKRWGRGIRKSQ